MQSKPDSAPPDEDIAESIRTGEYFRKARAMYDFSVHNPMAERYLYILITLLSMLAFFIAYTAMNAFYPLKRPVPFIFTLNNVVDDLPHIHSLIEHKNEDPSLALVRFFVKNYVTMREEYNIDTFERDVNGIESQSSPAVATEFQQAVDPHNPESPIVVYQRYSKRHITVLSVKPVNQDEFEVTYEASVEGKGDVKTSRWQANIAFQYSGLTLDEKTDKPNPVKFIVTQYHTKRL